MQNGERDSCFSNYSLGPPIREAFLFIKLVPEATCYLHPLISMHDLSSQYHSYVQSVLRYPAWSAGAGLVAVQLPGWCPLCPQGDRSAGSTC